MVCVLAMGTCKVERVNAKPLEEFQAEISRKAGELGLRGSASNDWNTLTRWSVEVQGPMRSINRFFDELEKAAVVQSLTARDVEEQDTYTTPDTFVFITWE